MTTLKNDDINEIIDHTGKPVFVYFGEDKITALNAIDRILELLSNEYGDKVEFIRVDVSENPNSAAQYEVTTLPTVLFIDKDGNVVTRESNVYTKIAMKALLQRFL